MRHSVGKRVFESVFYRQFPEFKKWYVAQLESKLKSYNSSSAPRTPLVTDGQTYIIKVLGLLVLISTGTEHFLTAQVETGILW